MVFKNRTLKRTKNKKRNSSFEVGLGFDWKVKLY